MSPELQAQIIQRQAHQVGELTFQNVVLASQVALLEQELSGIRAEQSGDTGDAHA